MLRERLIHDVAFAASQHILEVLAGCLREEEQRDAFEQIYERVKAAIECFEIHNNRPERRLDPEGTDAEMTRQERYVHVIACEATRRIEELLPIPKSQRALMFFELFLVVKRGLEEFSRRSEERENWLVPGNN